MAHCFQQHLGNQKHSLPRRREDTKKIISFIFVCFVSSWRELVLFTRKPVKALGFFRAVASHAG